MPLVAYFSMEYGLHEEFPSYAGGLGILAGDFMKSAGDLGMPVVGIGLRWAQGYTAQRIGEDGQPVDEWHDHKPDFLTDTGTRVRVRVSVSGFLFHMPAPCVPRKSGDQRRASAWKTELM